MMHVTQALPLAVIPQREIVESFLLSKTGAMDGGEDRIINGPRYKGIVDGATDKSGLNWSLCSDAKLTGGKFLAQVTAAVFSSPWSLSCSALTCVDMLNTHIQLRARQLEIDLQNTAFRPAASIVLYDCVEHMLLVVGDPKYGFVNARGEIEVHDHEDPSDTLAIGLRRWRVEYLRKRGEDPFADGRDKGREFVMPILSNAHMLVNAAPDDPRVWYDYFSVGEFAQRRLDGVHCNVLTTIPVPPGTKEIVLASDGYPVVCTTLEETEARLRELLFEDPMRVGANPGTKGLMPGAVSYDDRAYLRIRLMR